MTNKKMIPKSKRSQSETVGFVLIIVIVSVIAMIFLWFLFSGKQNDLYTSADMSDLLTASMFYTTNCSTTTLPQYKSGQELVRECYRNSGNSCLDGKNVCKALNEVIKETIANTLDISENSVHKAFMVNASYYVKDSTEPRENIFGYSEGEFRNCSARYGGYNSISQPPGYIEVRLQVCER